MRFTDRASAGQLLADKLQRFRDNAVVYALPRGGVVLGVEVAMALDAPLDLIISRKIGHPDNPEYAVCAVTETGPLLCSEYEQANLSKAWLKHAQQTERDEAKRRRQVYLSGRSQISAKGKIAIIVDDGVATGLTMRAAIAEVKKQNPSKVVVAVPVTPPDVATELRSEADELIALDIPKFYLGAVGNYYEDFPQLEDQEVIDLMETAK